MRLHKVILEKTFFFRIFKQVYTGTAVAYYRLKEMPIERMKVLKHWRYKNIERHSIESVHLFYNVLQFCISFNQLNQVAPPNNTLYHLMS